MRGLVLLSSVVALTALLAGCGSAARSHSTRSAYRPPRRLPLTVLSDTISPRACDGWLRGVLVGICDPAGLRQGYESHQINKPGDVHVTVTGRQLHGGGDRVLAQFDPSDGSGAGVEPGQTVTVTGHVSSGAYLYLRAQSRTGAVFASGEALFHQLGLEHGGSATVEVSLVHDRLRYALTRPDGTSAGPIATGGLGGPGPDAPVPGPAAGYADSPEEAAHTYVAAINARDGATVCSLFTKTLQQAYNREQMPCWAIVTVYIDFTGENADRAFKNLLLTATGSRRVQTVGGHRYVGVPLTLNFGFARASSASTIDHPQLRQTVDDVLWLEHVGSRWRIAKPSLALMTAGALVRQPGEDPLAAPGATGSTPSTQSTSLG